MTALLVVVLVVGVLLEAWIVYAYVQTSKGDPAHYRAQLNLHRARRRMEVGQFKGEVKRDAAQARRELRKALDEQDDASRRRG